VKSLPRVCPPGGIAIIVVTKGHKLDANATNKKSTTAVQCTAHLMVKFKEYISFSK
jgi:hypothetical protein